jgi:hypothetical protein
MCCNLWYSGAVLFALTIKHNYNNVINQRYTNIMPPSQNIDPQQPDMNNFTGSSFTTNSPKKFKARYGLSVLIFAIIGAVFLFRSFAATTLTGADGEYTSVVQARILDTRSAVGVTTTTPIAAGATISVQVAGKSGVPSTGVKAVVMNVSAVNPTAVGSLIVWPTGATRPTGGSVVFAPNESINNQITVPVASDGKVQIYNSAGNVHAVIEVVGYISNNLGPRGARNQSLTPTRILDTRSAVGVTTTTPIAAGATISVQVAGKSGVPSTGVKAVTMNVGAISPTTSGGIMVWPSGTARPTASVTAYVLGKNITNQTTVPVGADGKVQIYNTTGSTHVSLDITGYYALPKAGMETSQDGRYNAVVPSRIFDSRNYSALGAQKQRGVRVLGIGGIPPSDVKGIVVNFSAVAPANSGTLATWQSGLLRPNIGSLNYVLNQPITNQIIIPVGSYGKVQVYNSAGSTHFVLDVVGYISADAGTAKTNGNQRFAGDPNPLVSGKAYWGASVSQDINGNNDPNTRHEVPAGKSLAVRRTFWPWNKPKMIDTAKADIAANRLPFVSIKAPTSWAEVASGKFDTDLDTMLRGLDAAGGPVWLAVNHEPENDSTGTTPVEKCEKDPAKYGVCLGTPTDWRNMQIHVKDRMIALNTKNIAFMPILMTWTWDSRSGRIPTDWWVDGIWDAYISDHYHDTLTEPIATDAMWLNYVAFASARRIPYGTAEWGVRSGGAADAGYFANTVSTNPCVFVPRPTTADRENQAKTRHQEFWDWGFVNKKDVIVQSYYDACINSGLSPWSLGGAQLTQFQSILKNDTRIQRINQL